MPETSSQTKCSACKQFKPNSEFNKNGYRKNGLASECRPCEHERKLTFRKSERGKLWKKLYNGSEHGKRLAKEQKRKWYYTENGRISSQNRRLDPDERPKRRARWKLCNALRSGRMEKPTTCSKCGKESSRIHGHHHKGYKPEHWLDVIWLCPMCHTREEEINSLDSGLQVDPKDL